MLTLTNFINIKKLNPDDKNRKIFLTVVVEIKRIAETFVSYQWFIL